MNSKEYKARKRWGYGGTETALNGILIWMLRNLDPVPNNDACYDIMIEYAKANMKGFIQSKNINKAVDTIAKTIDRNDKFKVFTKWVLENTAQK